MIKDNQKYTTNLGEEVEILAIFDENHRTPVVAIVGDRYEYTVVAYCLRGLPICHDLGPLVPLNEYQGRDTDLYVGYLAGATINWQGKRVPAYETPTDLFRLSDPDKIFEMSELL